MFTKVLAGIKSFLLNRGEFRFVNLFFGTHSFSPTLGDNLAFWHFYISQYPLRCVVYFPQKERSTRIGTIHRMKGKLIWFITLQLGGFNLQ